MVSSDLRSAWRHLRHSPGLCVLATILLASGIGASTTVFTVAHAVLFRPLEIHEPNTLVQLIEVYPDIRPQTHLPLALYEGIRGHSSTFAEVIGRLEVSASMEKDGGAEHVDVDLVTDTFLSSLVLSTATGRVFGASDDHVAVLSYGSWNRYFQRDPLIAGKTVRLAGQAFQIVGVTPEGFNGISAELSPDFFVPFRDLKDFLSDANNDQNLRYLEIIGRLRPGTSSEQARQEIEPMWRRAHAPFATPDSTSEQQVRLEVRSIALGSSSIRNQYGTALLLIFGAALLLLMMVCANVGSLLLARAASKEKEAAVQIALGARQIHIARQWAIESALLSSGGAIGAALFTWIAIPQLVRWMPPVPGGAEPGGLRQLALNISPDTRVFAFFLAVSVCTAMLTSLAPIWRLSRNDLNLLLKTQAGEKRHRRLQAVLCTLQVAFSSVLLVSALLSYRTLSNLRAESPGFDATHVVTFSIDPGMRHYDASRAWSFRERLLADVRALPEVRDAALSGIPLMRGIGLMASLRLPGQQAAAGFNASMNVISDRYFDAMGIPLLSGRDLQQQDASVTPVPIIVNEAFAHRFFGSNDVIGRFAGVTGEGRPQYRIVGLAGDSHYRSMRELPPPVFYEPFLPRQAANRFLLGIRTSASPDSVVLRVREVMRSIDPAMPAYQVSTLAEEINRSLWQERLTQAVAASFALMAMILSAVGLYGMLAYFVIQHRREIGIRMAIGAAASDIVYLVSKRTLASVGCGIIAGAFLFVTAARSLQTILYGVHPFDRVSIAKALGIILVITAAAILIPSLHALRINPASTLRDE